MITAYDPEDKAERRRVGGLLHEPYTRRDEEMEVQNSSTTAEHNSTRKIFIVFQTMLATSAFVPRGNERPASFGLELAREH